MPATDLYNGFAGGVEGPATHAANITPDDSADLAYVTRAIVLDAAGKLKVTTMGGETLVTPTLAAGVAHPMRVTRIWATSTTATGIMALW